MTRSENGWTYLEFVVALMVFSLLIVLVYPLLTVFKSSDIEKQTHLQALWLGQETVERHMSVVSESEKNSGRETVRLDQYDYDIVWKRHNVRDGIDSVEVSVLWKTGYKQRELHLERYILLQ